VLYAGLTAVMITWFVVIGLVTSKVQDRVFLLFGHILNGCGTALFVYFLSVSPYLESLYVPLWQFCIVCGVYASAIPLYKSTMNSLFSKILNDSNLDGRGQSVMTSASSLGAVLGPFTSGLFLSFDVRWLQVTSAGLWAIVFLLMVFAWEGMGLKKGKKGKSGISEVENGDGRGHEGEGSTEETAKLISGDGAAVVGAAGKPRRGSYGSNIQ